MYFVRLRICFWRYYFYFVLEQCKHMPVCFWALSPIRIWISSIGMLWFNSNQPPNQKHKNDNMNNRFVWCNAFNVLWLAQWLNINLHSCLSLIDASWLRAHGARDCSLLLCKRVGCCDDKIYIDVPEWHMVRVFFSNKIFFIQFIL